MGLVARKDQTPQEMFSLEAPFGRNEYLAVYVKRRARPILLRVKSNVDHHGGWGWEIDEALLPTHIRRWLKEARDDLRDKYLWHPDVMAFELSTGAQWRSPVVIERIRIGSLLTFELLPDLRGGMLPPPRKDPKPPSLSLGEVVSYGSTKG